MVLTIKFPYGDTCNPPGGNYQAGGQNTMPKMKSHSGAKKRFKMTKTGKIKRGSAFRSHILTKKSTKRKRGFRAPTYVDKTNSEAIKVLLPYS